MGFNFTATARCHLCGNYLGSSEEECDHDGQEPTENMFRSIGEIEPEIVSVNACPGWHWQSLKKFVEEDWIAYQWLGPKTLVKNMVDGENYESVEQVPYRTMSHQAPESVESYEP